MSTLNNVFFNNDFNIICVTDYLLPEFNIIYGDFISIHNNFFIDTQHNLYVYNCETMNVQMIDGIKVDKILNHNFIVTTDKKCGNNYQSIIVNTDIKNIIEIYDYEVDNRVNYYFVTDSGDIFCEQNMIASGVDTFYFYRNALLYVSALCGNLFRVDLLDNTQHTYKNSYFGSDCVILFPCIFDDINELISITIYGSDENAPIPYFKSLVNNESNSSLHKSCSFFGLSAGGKIYEFYRHGSVFIEWNSDRYRSIHNISCKDKSIYDIYDALDGYEYKSDYDYTMETIAVGIDEQNNLIMIRNKKIIVPDVHHQISSYVLKNARSN